MRYLVKDINSDNARIIEAEGFLTDESGYTTFHDENSNPVARLINVTVEPVSASRESSKELVKLAQKYRNVSGEDIVKIGPEQTIKDIRSLAGSVLSQAGKED